MAGNVNVTPVTPVAPAPPAFDALVNQSAANAFAVTVAVQDANDLVNEGSGTTALTPAPVSASQGDNVALDESLASLSPQALIAINAVENSTVTGAANTNLTSAQLQEMQILQDDIAQIEAAGEAVPSVTVTDNGTDLNLTVAAVNALNDVTTVNGISSTNELTVAQIQKAAAVISPFINQPLTPQVLTQMQSALATAGFNPDQLSLQNLFLVMNYAIAETVEASSPETVAANEMVTEMEIAEE